MMNKTERVKRPEVERIEPSRSWAGALAPGADPIRTGRDALPAPTDDPSSTSARDSGYEAVNSAYRVIDEYMRQGQRFAEEFWLPTADGSAAAPQFPRMLERFLRSAGDMGTAWIEMMTAGAKQGPPDVGPRGTAGPFAAGHRPEHPSAPPAQDRAAQQNFSIAVQSVRPVRVSIDAVTTLVDIDVYPLMASDRTLPPITIPPVEIDPEDGRALVRVVIPADQPCGVYHGVLLDRRTQRPGGTISVRIE
jgi:hypothetical protein